MALGMSNRLKTASNTVEALQITVIAGPTGSKTARPIKIKQYK
jgi:nicotinamide mononucleotide (NMN) deamidase PncC